MTQTVPVSKNVYSEPPVVDIISVTLLWLRVAQERVWDTPGRTCLESSVPGYKTVVFGSPVNALIFSITHLQVATSGSQNGGLRIKRDQSLSSFWNKALWENLSAGDRMQPCVAGFLEWCQGSPKIDKSPLRYFSLQEGRKLEDVLEWTFNFLKSRRRLNSQHIFPRYILNFYTKNILCICHPINNVKEIMSMGYGMEARKLPSVAVMKPIEARKRQIA